ncbi:MAG: ATP-grasp domain-containing protein [Alphaproteobacteria bacterium]|nr:ATP-grasp domain-containing protein [Alphaproteobacteria bacterium]
MKLRWLIFAALSVALPVTLEADTSVDAARAASSRGQVVVLPQPVPVSIPQDDNEIESRAATRQQVVAPLPVGRTAPAAAGRTMPQTQSRTAVPAQAVESARAVQRRQAGAATDNRAEGSRAVRAAATDFTETRNVNVRDNNVAARRATAIGRERDANARQSIAEVGGRAVIARTGEYTGTNVDFRAATRNRVSRGRAAEDIQQVEVAAAAASPLNACVARYEECMDQFCNIIDDRQQRCSCSANIQNYQAAEEQLKRANQELNNVAQNIRYIGLSAEEIHTLFTETEAELAMRNVTDTTINRSLLQEIEDMIMGATTNLAGNVQRGQGGVFDITFDFDSDMDLTEMFGGFGTTNIANLRGQKLRDAAAKKCKPILDDCQRQNVRSEQVIASFDLRVEKDCIEYEQTLRRMNDSVANNIRAAQTMLQRARLTVLHDQNELDFKGCVQALDHCVLEDTACGRNYIRCLDPSRRFLDETGKVIFGSNLPLIRNNFIGAVDAGGTIIPMNEWRNQPIINNLKENKVGVPGQSGMCADVMKRCRRLTFPGPSGGTYREDNEVIKAFMARAINQMNVSASRVVSDFASRCLQEVGTCYNTQVTNMSAWTSGWSAVSAASVKNVMIGACRSVAITCAASIFMNNDDLCPVTNPNPPAGQTGLDEPECIENLSNLFYNSLLCGPNMIFNGADQKCYCMEGFELVGGFCRQCQGVRLDGATCPTTPSPLGWVSTGAGTAVSTVCCAAVAGTP